MTLEVVLAFVTGALCGTAVGALFCWLIARELARIVKTLKEVG